MKQKVLLNSFSGVAQVLINIGLLMVTIPVFIHKLGIVNYGTYALITSVGNLGVFTNFGFNTSLIKYLAEQRDRAKSNYDIAVAFILVAVTTISVACAILLSRDFVLMKILGLSKSSLTNSVVWLLGYCIVANVFQILSQIPSAVLDSQQKVYITNSIQIATGVIGRFLMLLILFVFPDLAALGAALLFTSILTFTLLTWYSLTMWGPFTCPELLREFFPITKKHFIYGRTIYLTSLMNFFYEPLTKVLLSRYIGLAEVGFFDLALKIRLLVNSVLDKLLYPLFPLLAQLSDPTRIRDIILEVQHKIILLLVPLIIVVFFITQPLIQVWIGINITTISVSVVIIVAFNLITILYQPVYLYLTVKGYPEKTLLLQSINVSVNLFLFWITVPTWGYYGVLASYCCALISSIAVCAYYEWTYLQATPIQSPSHFQELGILGILLILVNLLLARLPLPVGIYIVALLVVDGVLTLLVIRRFIMINKNDIVRYIGSHSSMQSMIEKLFIRQKS